MNGEYWRKQREQGLTFRDAFIELLETAPDTAIFGMHEHTVNNAMEAIEVALRETFGHEYFDARYPDDEDEPPQ